MDNHCYYQVSNLSEKPSFSSIFVLLDRGSSLVHVDKVRNLDDVLRLRHASMATCARVLPFVLNVFRKHG